MEMRPLRRENNFQIWAISYVVLIFLAIIITVVTFANISAFGIIGRACILWIVILTGALYHFGRQRTRLTSATTELEARWSEMGVVDEIGRIITSTLDIDQVYERFVLEVNKLVDFDRISINIIDQDAQAYTHKYLWGPAYPSRRQGDIMPLECSWTQHVMTTGQTLIREDTSEDIHGLRSGIAVPLASKGSVIGSLFLRSCQVGRYGSKEQAILERLAHQIAPAVENARLFEQLVSELEQRELTEEALRASEEQHRTLLDFYPDGVLVEIDSRIAYCNPAMMEISGYAEEEILDTPPMEFIAPEDRQRASAVVRKLLDGTPGGTREYRVLKKDGTIMPTEISSRLITHAGKPALLSVVRDITKRQQAEEALRESEMRFRQISENMREIIFLVDHRTYKVLYVNDAYEEIWGQPCKSLYNNPMIWLDAVHPDDRIRVEAALTNQQSTGKFEEEFRIVRPDGTIRWIFDRVFPIQNEAGEIYRLVGIADDITERKETEQRMNETARLASIGALAAGVAHEINNPLTSVLGFSQLLMAEDLPPELRSDLQRVHSNAQRAAKVVQNLLFFARRRDFRKEYMNLATILERALEIKSYDLTTSNIRVNKEISPDLPFTMVDEHQLIQAILNLLTNAEQALRSSDREGQILVQVTSSETKIMLSISDNGPGIPPEHMDRVFEPFFTTMEVGEGTGLGLSICYGIIRQHDGDLWAESIPGEGATFHIELPIVGPEGGEVVEPPDQQQQQIPSATKHLLVVDDEPDIRDLLVRSLELERYTVDLADGGEAAWRKLQVMPYDCILLDLKMPGISGQELFELIEDTDIEVAKKVIFITGDTISPETQDFVFTTGYPVVSKPLDMDDLRRQVREVLEATSGA